MAENAYEEYCRQVRSALKKATQKERSSFTEELLDHMESHAEVLMELGWDPEEARDYSVQAMGDPEVVGRQYDEKLSSFWLVCWYVLRMVLAILVVWFALGFVSQWRGTMNNLRARWMEENPWFSHSQEIEILGYQIMDIKIPLELYTVRIFRTEIYRDELWEGYAARVYVVCYPNNPLYNIGSPVMDGAGVKELDLGVGTSEDSVGYRLYYGPVEKGLDHVTFYIENVYTNTHIQVDVPLDWEGIP